MSYWFMIFVFFLTKWLELCEHKTKIYEGKQIVEEFAITKFKMKSKTKNMKQIVEELAI